LLIFGPLPALIDRVLLAALNVLTVKLLPLRLQRERILPLFYRFLKSAARELELEASKIDPVVSQILLNHDWPGNIRELKSTAKRFVLGLPLFDSELVREGESPTALKFQLRLIERMLIQESLKRNQHSIDAVSRELDIPRRTLYHRMKELDV